MKNVLKLKKKLKAKILNFKFLLKKNQQQQQQQKKENRIFFIQLDKQLIN